MSTTVSAHPAPASGPADPSLDATTDLLARIRAGEQPAVEKLFQKCLPVLRRWARGRLPGYARDMVDTQDVVQDALVNTMHRLSTFESRHTGALQAYLRQAVVNRIRDEIRRASRRPLPAALDEQEPDSAPSPLAHAMGREGVERYLAALQNLRPCERKAITARFELHHSYDEVAILLDKPSANAARAAVTRALARLLEEMAPAGPPSTSSGRSDK